MYYCLGYNCCLCEAQGEDKKSGLLNLCEMGWDYYCFNVMDGNKLSAQFEINKAN